MATTTAKTATSQDAIALLKADHAKVHQLFEDFKELKEAGSPEEKGAIVEEVCNALIVHTQIEENIFYPAVREAIDDADLMDEAIVEHAGAKELIEQLQAMDPEDDLYDAKVTVLGEQIDHHVQEEEGEIFPKAKKAKVDTLALGAKMMEQKAALLEELGIDEDDDDLDADEDEDEEDEDDDEVAEDGDEEDEKPKKPAPKK